jgi:hypothetical protein
LSRDLLGKAGDVWGLLTIYREPGQRQFEPDELRFLRAVAPYLAEGARRGLLDGEATDPEGPEAPGLVVLREDWSVESLTPGVDRWLAELPDGDWASRGRLSPAVLAVAGGPFWQKSGISTSFGGEIAKPSSSRMRSCHRMVTGRERALTRPPLPVTSHQDQLDLFSADKATAC